MSESLNISLISTVLGFLLGLLSTLAIDLLKENKINKIKNKSLKSFLKVEQRSNLELLKSLNDHFKIENLHLNSDALLECLKNPHLFEQELFDKLIELNSDITFYNVRMPTESVMVLSPHGKFKIWSTNFKDLKFKLEDLISDL